MFHHCRLPCGTSSISDQRWIPQLVLAKSSPQGTKLAPHPGMLHWHTSPREGEVPSAPPQAGGVLIVVELLEHQLELVELDLVRGAVAVLLEKDACDAVRIPGPCAGLAGRDQVR